jgi:hypothetical protein
VRLCVVMLCRNHAAAFHFVLLSHAATFRRVPPCYVGPPCGVELYIVGSRNAAVFCPIKYHVVTLPLRDAMPLYYVK